MAHREHPGFPEVSVNRIWLMREYVFSQVAKKSFRILVDSEIGKQEVIKYYHIKENKVVVLPYVPPNYLNVELTNEKSLEIIKYLNLPSNFFFYPAQFWRHKNHINIVKAIKILKDQNIIVNMVFCGDKKEEMGEFKKVIDYSNENNIEKQIYYLGYVDNLVISALYKLATALVMPTFFGPTNIPILEAWKMHCPVIYSNIRGCKEQAGDAALLVDPNSPEDIADKMKMIVNDKNLRRKLIMRGEKRLEDWSFVDFSKKIHDILNNYKIYGSKKN
jgi:glycosyltransferase involved in cell wall biosynthesis